MGHTQFLGTKPQLTSGQRFLVLENLLVPTEIVGPTAFFNLEFPQNGLQQRFLVLESVQNALQQRFSI
jgi:hypothetical protein